MQFPKVVTGNRSIHMVFDVIVHVPIEKGQEGIQNYGSGTESEIGYIVPKPCMLSAVAQIAQPAAVEWRKGGQDWQHPETKVERESDNQNMAQENDTGPAKQMTSPRWV